MPRAERARAARAAAMERGRPPSVPRPAGSLAARRGPISPPAYLFGARTANVWM